MMRSVTSLFFVLSILSAFPAAVFAQTGTLEGTVRDVRGLPLPGINVYIADSQIGTATDLNGFFRITRVPTGEQTLIASAVGFRRQARPVTVTENETVQVDFVLEEVMLESGEVVVTASRRAQLSANTPVSISTLTPRELEVRNIVTLDDALRYMPGVQMADNQISVRGSSGFSFNVGSRVLLLVDGVPLLGPETGGVPFEALPMSQVERIEVVKGPGSALYGGGALGGVIHMITKDFPEAPETSIRLFAGAYEPVRYAVWKSEWTEADSPRPLGGGILTHARRFGDRGGMWVNLSYRSDAGYMNFSKERAFQGHAKVGWRFNPSWRIDVLGGATIREADNFFYWNGARDALNPGRIDIIGEGASGTNDLTTRQFSFLPTLTHIASSNLFFTARGRLFRAVFHPLDDLGNLRPRSERTAGYRFGGEIQMDWMPVNGRFITAGITADGNAAESKFLTGEDGRLVRGQPEGALYVQWEEKVTSRLRLVGGLRFDAYQIDTTNVTSRLSPKLNASYSLNDYLTFRASYGKGFRVPSLAERFTNNRDFFPVIPNLKLLPEESTGYELGGIGLLPLPRGGGIQLDVALFWNDYWNLVEPKFVAGGSGSGTSETGFQFVNLTRARIRGMETTAEIITLNQRLRGRVGYTLLDARDLTEHRPLVFRSRDLVKAALEGMVAPFLSVGVDYRYAGRPERVDSDFARFVPDAELTVPIHVLDLRTSLRWRKFETVLILNNALEYYYVERPAILAPTRHLIVQISARF